MVEIFLWKKYKMAYRRQVRVRKPRKLMKWRSYRGVTYPTGIVRYNKVARLSLKYPHRFTRYMQDITIMNDAATGNVCLADSLGAKYAVPSNGWNIGTPSGYGATLTSANGTKAFSAGYIVQFANIINSTEFQSLFDRYRIRGCKVQIIPMNNSARTYSSDSLGTCTIVRDYDDANLVSLENEVLEKEGSRTYRLSKPVSIYFKPRLTQGLMDNTGAIVPVGIKAGSNQWINMSNMNINHYGLKLYFNDVNVPASTGVSTIFKIRTKLYFECKDTQ